MSCVCARARVCAPCLSIHPTIKPKLGSFLPKPKQLSPTLHKLAAAHAPLTHNCQSTDTAGSEEEEGGEGERSDEEGGVEERARGRQIGRRGWENRGAEQK